ncbi:cholecystokinin receptor-like [Limulus polyphemus]|uniref:Cholecystokinin receptor-like n=1 Tax=Limulus polyphemus TaxID=6850 RepID=A0ABM1S558_LIMPO|nr:cholecystokinin receptor-like [Limulus polyphemus]
MYCIIFIFSVLGNTLVIVTLVQNKRMKTVTNVFLMNLAVSDLLLGVFCMPFTLVGSLLRNFIFGEVMCRLIPYLQAVSVSVSVWTLASISLERFFAICQPFRSRQWQTISHSYKVIVWIWIGSLLTMLPLAVLSRLLPTKVSGRYKCRDVWPNVTSERVFNLYLDAALLIIPLVIMTFMYFLIIHTLYVDLEDENEDLPLRFLASRSQKAPQNRQDSAKPVIVQMAGNRAYNTFTVTSRSRITVHRHLVRRGHYCKNSDEARNNNAEYAKQALTINLAKEKPATLARWKKNYNPVIGLEDDSL